MWIGSLALGRHSVLRRLLLQGHHPRIRLRGPYRRRHVRLLARRRRGDDDGVLFLAPAGHDLPWRDRAPTTRPMHHVHESPWVMLVPLIVLAVGAVFAGWLVLRRLRRRAHGSVLGRVHPVRRGQRGAAPRPRGAAVGQAGAAGGRHRRHRARLRVLHVQDRPPGQAGRRDGRAVPLPAQQVVFRRAVRGDSSSSRPRSSASACGRAATARSSTGSAPMASPASRRTSPSRRPGCSPATSITTPSRC